ncbi:MAG: thioredoxin-disulfide reductase [Desulfomonile tiedjei]|nr:thioredoxin-disulfide reductase [Desulfomonile tiedjei]
MQRELVILGGGPAGLTAGIYASRARIPALLLEKGIPGGQMTATEVVDNYPGFEEPVLGVELARRMESHAKKFGLEIVQQDVRLIVPTKQGFVIESESGESNNCRALILATGASPVKLGIPGEVKLAGRGVSYCAVCDGPFFADLEVAVVGGGDSAVEEAVYLTRFASRVHIIHRRDQLRAVKEIQEKAFANPNITVQWNSVPVAVLGDAEVKGLKICSVIDGAEKVLPVGGVFFYVGLHPNTQGFQDVVETDDRGFIVTDRNMVSSRPGVFAAGDVRSKNLRQISTAVGDGALAAFSAQQYLESL